MKQTLLIALLALTGFTSLPALSNDAATAVAADAVQQKPCASSMGPMQGMGMPGMRPMLMAGGHACPPGACQQVHALDERIEQLEKRIDALQMTIKLLVDQQDD